RGWRVLPLASTPRPCIIPPRGQGRRLVRPGSRPGDCMRWCLRLPRLVPRRRSHVPPEEARYAPHRPTHVHATHTPPHAPRDPRGPHGLGGLAGVAAPAARHGPEGRPGRPDDLGAAFHPDPTVV